MLFEQAILQWLAQLVALAEQIPLAQLELLERDLKIQVKQVKQAKQVEEVE